VRSQSSPTGGWQRSRAVAATTFARPPPAGRSSPKNRIDSWTGIWKAASEFVQYGGHSILGPHGPLRVAGGLSRRFRQMVGVFLTWCSTQVRSTPTIFHTANVA
jgi:hypothetical protein